MDITLNNQTNFPIGTTVGAYLVANWHQGELPPSGPPKGVPEDEAVVDAKGDVTFVELDNIARYFAVAEVDGQWRYVRFSRGERTGTVTLGQLDRLFDPEGEPAGKIVRGYGPRSVVPMVDRDEWWAGDFGAKFNGDDETTEMLTAAHESQVAKKPLRLPPGVTGLSAGLIDLADNALDFFMFGSGRGQTIIERDGFAAAVVKKAGPALTEVTTLTAEAAIGASTIKVASTAGMSRQMALLLRDKTSGIEGTSSGGIASLSGEWVRVKAVLNSTEFTIYGRLRWKLTAGSDIRTFNGVTPKVGLGDFDIDNAVPGESETGFAKGIFLENCLDPLIARLKISRLDASAIYLSRVLGGTVENVHFYEMQNEEEPTAPYSIAAVNGTSGLAVVACRGRYGRHLITCGGGAGTDIGTQDIEVWSCVVREYNGAAFDAHPGSRWVHFFHCVAINCDSYGFQLRGPDMSVHGGRVSGTPTGAYVVDGADRAYIAGLVVDEPEIGIAVRDSNDITIQPDVLIRNPRKKGYYVEPVRSPYIGHMTKQLFEGRVTGNPSEGALVVSNENSGFTVGPRFFATEATTVFAGITRTPLSTTTIVHGSDKTKARPVGYDHVTWIGTVEPEHAAENDRIDLHE